MKRMGVGGGHEKKGEGLEQFLRGMEGLWIKDFKFVSSDHGTVVTEWTVVWGRIRRSMLRVFLSRLHMRQWREIRNKSYR